MACGFTLSPSPQSRLRRPDKQNVCLASSNCFPSQYKGKLFKCRSGRHDVAFQHKGPLGPCDRPPALLARGLLWTPVTRRQLCLYECFFRTPVTRRQLCLHDTCVGQPLQLTPIRLVKCDQHITTMLVMLTTFHETPPAAPPPTTTTTTTAKEEGGYMTTFPVKHVKCPKFSRRASRADCA